LLAVCWLTRRGTLRCRAVVGEYCTFFVPVSTATTGRCRVCAPEIVLIHGEVNFCLWWPERRYPTRPVGEQAALPGITGPVLVSSGGRGIGGDLLATQLVVNRRLVHGATL
jgi:hypothetical protein